MIDNGNNITSIYAHLSNIYVYKGEKVTIGQIIGEEGSTGWSTGPHLHFQIDVFWNTRKPQNISWRWRS